MITGGYPWDQSERMGDRSRIAHGVFDGLSEGANLIQTVSYGLWFIQFALSHKSPNSKQSVLPPHSAIALDTGLLPQRPTLLPLNEVELKALQEHESYTLKKSDRKRGR
jgi:hypothetical protein